jgi:hypothetical protein
MYWTLLAINKPFEELLVYLSIHYQLQWLHTSGRHWEGQIRKRRTNQSKNPKFRKRKNAAAQIETHLEVFMMWESFRRPYGEGECRHSADDRHFSYSWSLLTHLLCHNSRQLEKPTAVWEILLSTSAIFYVNCTFCYWKSRNDDEMRARIWSVRRINAEGPTKNTVRNFTYNLDVVHFVNRLFCDNTSTSGFN